MKMRIILLVLCFGLIFACENKLDVTRLPEKDPEYVMRDTLICTVVESSDKSEVGEKITLTGLNTESPKAKFSGGPTTPMQKIYESKSTLTIVLLAGRGNIDAFVVDKENGHFARVVAGDFYGVYANASIGTCR